MKFVVSIKVRRKTERHTDFPRQHHLRRQRAGEESVDNLERLVVVRPTNMRCRNVLNCFPLLARQPPARLRRGVVEGHDAHRRFVIQPHEMIRRFSHRERNAEHSAFSMKKHAPRHRLTFPAAARGRCGLRHVTDVVHEILQVLGADQVIKTWTVPVFVRCGLPPIVEPLEHLFGIEHAAARGRCASEANHIGLQFGHAGSELVALADRGVTLYRQTDFIVGDVSIDDAEEFAGLASHNARTRENQIPRPLRRRSPQTTVKLQRHAGLARLRGRR